VLETSTTFFIPVISRLRLVARSYQDSIPGRSAPNPFFRRRASALAEDREAALGGEAMLPGELPPRWPQRSRRSGPRVRVVPADARRRCFVRGTGGRPCRTSEVEGWYGTVESMQKLARVRAPRLRAWDELQGGAFRSVGSMNFQRSAAPGREERCRGRRPACPRAVRGAAARTSTQDRTVDEAKT